MAATRNKKPQPRKGQSKAEAKKERAEFLERFRKAVQAGAGIIAHSAKNLEISRVTFYDWIDNDPELMAIYLEAIEEVDDFVESTLLKNIHNEEGKVPFQVQQRAMEFWLSNRRRSKWRREKVLEDGPVDEPVDIQGILAEALKDYREQPGSSGANARLPAPDQ